jgi:DNA-binding GntR family transcriptional regulator
MIKWVPKHRWEVVMEDLRERILDGEYQPRTAIPSIPRLMQVYEVGRNTVLRAVSSLEEQGLVVARQSQGTFVIPPEDRPQR